MNQVLGISIKKICLSLLNVIASLRRALLVDALGETSWLDKPPRHVNVGFIEGDDQGIKVFRKFCLWTTIGMLYPKIYWHWYFICHCCLNAKLLLNPPWRRSASYINQFTELLYKSMDWFLYDRDLRHERVKYVLIPHCSQMLCKECVGSTIYSKTYQSI